MGKIPHLDHGALLQMLHYDPETGVFTWRHRPELRSQWNGRYAGKVAGYARIASCGKPYWSVRIHDWPFHANRLAWFYMLGEWPEAIVDHKDCDGLNNRWSNLRLATKSQNGANTRKPSTNTSGFKGVSLCKHNRRWRATIRVDGRQKWLGYHDTPEAAHAAYLQAAIERSGEFARAA